MWQRFETLVTSGFDLQTGIDSRS